MQHRSSQRSSPHTKAAFALNCRRERRTLTNSLYVNREFAEKELKIKDLDKVKGLEITVRVIS